MDKLEITKTVTAEYAGQRLDQVVSQLLPEHSRSRIQGWIKSGSITVNSKQRRQRDAVADGDHIEINVEFEADQSNHPESIPLDIVHEDESIIVLNKPAGLVVHPGAGNPRHTLVNALLSHDEKLALLPRAGIVHRLDKDTTGVMVVARTLAAHTFLVEKLQAREIKREYRALVCGRLTSGSSIDCAIGRHATRRTRMAVTSSGKEAVTHYRIDKKFDHYTLLQIMLETGRTHQIRVHMDHIRHPVVGDPVYGKHQSIMKGINDTVRSAVTGFSRQALHARQLGLIHPRTNQSVSYQADIPGDMQALIDILDKEDRNGSC